MYFSKGRVVLVPAYDIIVLMKIYTSTLFKYGMWWRIFYGVLRTIFGFILLKLVDVPFADLLYKVMNYELVEDPSDMLFYTLHTFLQTHPLTVTHFVAAYLIFWGVVDVFLSVSLLKHQKWAFPVSLYLITFFVAYEIYRLFFTHSFILLSVILVDTFVFWLIWREYRNCRIGVEEFG